MARAPLLVFLAVLAGVLLFPVRSHLTAPREVIASTPSAYTGQPLPLPLAPGARACADEVLFDRAYRVVRFRANPPLGQKTAPPLEVVARGYPEGPYRNDYRATARVPGGWSGTRAFDVALDPPREDSWGTLCVTNAGRRPVELVGSEDGRAFSRPSVQIDGQPTPVELEFRLLEPGPRSFLSRAGTIMERASTLRPFGAWWWWLLAGTLITLVPLGVWLAMRSALVDDDAGEHSPQ